ncbi:MAG: alpha/beta fold hydrolase [Streptosporangiaceae bacterium]
MTTSPTTGVAKTDGADLYFERRGDGPPLLLIAGGGGDCGGLEAMAGILASGYTVLSYDRRGNSRSPLHYAPVPITMTEQSADAVAVLAAGGFESARIFGNSGGATIALDLAARYPAAVTAVVAHEPPLPRVLPDAARYLCVYDEIDRVLATQGWEAAFRLFHLQVGHVPAKQLPYLMAVLLRPASVLPPGPQRDVLQRLSRNWEYMTRFEIASFIRYLPDLDRIAADKIPVALAAGTDTIALASRADLGHDPFHRVSVAIAERLGAECAEVPGGHPAPSEVPGPFAAAVRDLFGRL